VTSKLTTALLMMMMMTLRVKLRTCHRMSIITVLFLTNNVLILVIRSWAYVVSVRAQLCKVYVV